MKIVYGLSGEGRGHGSLAMATLPILKKAGHEVKVITYGQSIEQLTKYNPIKIEGISLHYTKDNRFSLVKTIWKNLHYLKFSMSRWRSLRREIKEFSPDVIIVNFEPLTSLLALSLKIPLISFDGQHALLYMDHKEIPIKHRIPFLIAKTAIKSIAPWAEYKVIISFEKILHKHKNVHFVPPVIKKEMKKVVPKNGKHILVYFKKPNPFLMDTLKKIESEFIIYGFNIDKKDQNLTYRKTSDRIYRDISNCKAILATAGTSLISEAIYLKKPYFAVPPKDEFEQMMNAMFLKKAGFGDFSERPSAKQIKDFIKKNKSYKKNLSEYKFDSYSAGKTLLKLIKEISSR